jgi:hypothetical protein
MSARRPIALTCGDPAGVGPELIARLLGSERRDLVPVGPASWLASLPVPGVVVGPDGWQAKPGKPESDGHRVALAAMERAAEGCRDGEFSAVVTGPVSKAGLASVGFRHPGQTEFFAERLAPVRDSLVELGRSCVHRDYRTGGTIMLLWAGLGELLAGGAGRYLIGCASVSGAEDGRYAASLWQRVWSDHAAPEAFRVRPRSPLRAPPLAGGCEVVVPPLLKGYLRAGAMLLGEPHVDSRFGCVDIPVMLPLDRMQSRYARRFVRA